MKYIGFLPKKKLAEMYKINIKTLSKWIGSKQRRHFLTPLEVLIVFDRIGLPPDIEKIEFITISSSILTKNTIARMYQADIRTIYKYLPSDRITEKKIPATLLIKYLGLPFYLIEQTTK